MRNLETKTMARNVCGHAARYLMLVCILSGCCAGSDAWVVESIDSPRAWGSVPPRVEVADGFVFVHALEDRGREIAVFSLRRDSKTFKRVFAEYIEFTSGEDFAVDSPSEAHGCVIEGEGAARRMVYWFDSASGLRSELIVEGAHWSCSVVQDAGQRKDVFFGRGGELRHAWRDEGEAWSFETVASTYIGNNALDSARAADGLHVAFSSSGELHYAYLNENEDIWEMRRLGDGGYPALDLDGAGQPHIVVMNGTHVDWWHRDVEGSWSVELVFRHHRTKDLKHIGMAVDGAGLPAVVVTEWNPLPWSVETTLVQKRDGKWEEEPLPWAATTNITFDGQQRLHAVFADKEGVKHAVR